MNAVISSGPEQAGRDRSMPDELSPRRVGRRLLEVAVVGVAVALTVLTGPGLGELRNPVAHASPAWLFAGVGLEVLSALLATIPTRR
jgi:hypothetical protein